MLLFFILENPAITLEIVIASKTKEKENIVNGVSDTNLVRPVEAIKA